MEYANPHFFWLLWGVPLLWWFYFRRQQKSRIPFSSLTIDTLKASHQLKASSWKSYLDLILKTAGMILLILAMARPQSVKKETIKKSSGLDIVLAIDASKSMLERDYVLGGRNVSRLMAVKKVVKDFIKERPFDRIGLVFFGDFAFTRSPLTLDHEVLLRFVDELQIGVAGNSTAIGDAIAISVKRVKDIESKSKIVILLTDGEDNASQISPLEAADIASKMKTKVYTIGMQSSDRRSVFRMGYGGQPNMKPLQEIAARTNAKFFKVKTSQNLQAVYTEIDRLEKTEVDTKEFSERTEEYFPFIYGSLIFFVLGLLFNLTFWRRIP